MVKAHQPGVQEEKEVQKVKHYTLKYKQVICYLELKICFGFDTRNGFVHLMEHGESGLMKEFFPSTDAQTAFRRNFEAGFKADLNCALLLHVGRPIDLLCSITSPTLRAREHDCETI